MIETSSKLPLNPSRHLCPPPSSPLTRGPWSICDAHGNAVMLITQLRITPVDEEHALQGLIAFLTIEIDGMLRIDGVALRMTRAGALTLSFPRRSSRSGKSTPIVNPMNAEARTAIERTIFEALGSKESVRR